MSELLLEVLAEEIPAGVLPAARHELLQETGKALRENRITGTFFVHSTPRRLVLTAKDLPAQQDDTVTETIGPPVSVAFDANGNPTRASEGFAKVQGVPVETLVVVKTAKGDYAAARRLVAGKRTLEVLAGVLPAVIQKMSFPRMMRWGAGTYTWVRPVHSVVALFDGEVIPFTLFGVETGRTTAGHRTLAPARIIVDSAEAYFEKLRAGFVEPDLSVRRRRLSERADALASDVGGKPAADAALLDTWSHLVETPGLVRGSFDPHYLELPDEILVTSMREHQKVLPIRREDGRLTNHFLAVTDQTSDPKGYIARGNEWVLNARFADARFFYEDDGKTRLASRLDRLARLQFHEKLGDYRAKSERLRGLARKLADRLSRGELAAAAERAALLSKCDLVTGMVGEFPDLQGVVGGLYARRDGEPEDVWQAVYDQYRPASLESESPRGDAGAILAIADRLDTLTGFFGLGLVPSGSKDPYALRRAALGIVKVLVDKGWHLDVSAACADALAQHAALPRTAEEITADVTAFLLDRLRYVLAQRGFRSDEIEAVLATDCRDLADAAVRVAAVAAVRTRADFAPLATAFKRVQNILEKAPDAGDEPDLHRMTEEAEKQLASDYLQARAVLDDLVARRRYEEALAVMASLGPSLDRFFVEVLVMAEDPEVRANRLALLSSMRRQLGRVAKFSEIQA